MQNSYCYLLFYKIIKYGIKLMVLYFIQNCFQIVYWAIQIEYIVVELSWVEWNIHIRIWINNHINITITYDVIWYDKPMK